MKSALEQTLFARTISFIAMLCLTVLVISMIILGSLALIGLLLKAFSVHFSESFIDSFRYLPFLIGGLSLAVAIIRFSRIRQRHQEDQRTHPWPAESRPEFSRQQVSIAFRDQIKQLGKFMKLHACMIIGGALLALGIIKPGYGLLAITGAAGLVYAVVLIGSVIMGITKTVKPTEPGDRMLGLSYLFSAVFGGFVVYLALPGTFPQLGEGGKSEILSMLAIAWLVFIGITSVWHLINQARGKD